MSLGERLQKYQNHYLANPLEWTRLDRGLLLLLFASAAQLLYTIWAVFSLYHPNAADHINSNNMPLVVAAFATLTGISILLSVLGLAIRQSHKDSLIFQYLAAQYYAISMVTFGYATGTLSFATGLVLGCGPLFGFVFLERRVIYAALVSALTLAVTLTYASTTALIPYAPALSQPIFSDNQLSAYWAHSMYFFTAPHLLLTVFVADQLLLRWHQREAQVKTLSMIDGLTGVLNRRAVMDGLARETARMQRHNHPLSVVMLDLDHFKPVNDNYGHPLGDLVLRETAAKLRNVARQADMIGRYGGEEFILILPETDLEGAATIAERLRKTIADLEIPVSENNTLTVTASFGIACSDPEKHQSTSYEELIKRADLALYEAKESGRNRVCRNQN